MRYTRRREQYAPGEQRPEQYAPGPRTPELSADRERLDEEVALAIGSFCPNNPRQNMTDEEIWDLMPPAWQNSPGKFDLFQSSVTVACQYAMAQWSLLSCKDQLPYGKLVAQVPAVLPIMLNLARVFKNSKQRAFDEMYRLQEKLGRDIDATHHEFVLWKMESNHEPMERLSGTLSRQIFHEAFQELYLVFKDEWTVSRELGQREMQRILRGII